MTMAERNAEAPLAWFRQHEIRDDRDTGGGLVPGPAPEPSAAEWALAKEISAAWEATPHGTGPRSTAADNETFHALFNRPEIIKGAVFGPFSHLGMVSLVAALALRDQYREALAAGDFDLALLSVQSHSRALAVEHWHRHGLEVHLVDPWPELDDEDEDEDAGA
jgi:hypothetical protein